jgi:hypothetical protein
MKHRSQTTDYILDKLELINASGLGIDISNVMVHMTIVENMDAGGIIGEMKIIDLHQNIKEALPLVGSEKINIKFRTDKSAHQWSKTMWVTGIGDQEESDTDKKIFTLFFISEVMWNNNQTISKYYKGRNSDIVEDILLNVLIPAPSKYTSGYHIHTQQTKYQREFIAPNWKPLDIINYLAEESISMNGLNDFVFFENSHGVNFVSLSHIISTGIEPHPDHNGKVTEFNYYKGETQYNIGNSDALNNNPLKIYKQNVRRAFDMELTHSQGGIANSLMTHDILNKGFNTTEIHYQNEFKRYLDVSATTGKTPIFQPAGISPFTNHSHTTTGKINIVPENYNNSKVTEQLMQRQMRMNSWNQHILNLTFGSNSNLTIGSYLYVNVKSWKPGIYTEINKDQQMDGIWLIHTVKHVFLKKSSHITTVQLKKDAFNYK